MENKLLDSGDIRTYQSLYPHMSESDIRILINQRRRDKKEQTLFETDLLVESGKKLVQAGLDPSTLKNINEDSDKVSNAKIDNRAKHSQDSSNQKGNAKK